MNDYNFAEIPIGLSMTLSKNQKALDRFASLSHAQQHAFIQGAQQVASRKEMAEYVNKL